MITKTDHWKSSFMEGSRWVSSAFLVLCFISNVSAAPPITSPSKKKVAPKTTSATKKSHPKLSQKQQNDLWKLEANSKYLSKDNAGAIALLNKVLATDPQDMDALVQRGLVKKEAGSLGEAKADFKKAIPRLTRLIQANPKKASLYQTRANAYQGIDELHLAMADIKQTLALDPNQKVTEFQLQILETLVALKKAAGQSTSSGEAAAIENAAKDPQGVNLPLQKWMRDSDWIVRRDAALSAGETGERGYIPTLTTLTRDPRPEVREVAKKSLAQLK